MVPQGISFPAFTGRIRFTKRPRLYLLDRPEKCLEHRSGERLEYSYHHLLRKVLYERLQERSPQLLEQRLYSETTYQDGRARDS